MDNIKVKKSTKEWKTKGIAAASFITVFVIQAGLSSCVSSEGSRLSLGLCVDASI